MITITAIEVTGRAARVSVQADAATGTMTVYRDTLDGPLQPLLGAAGLPIQSTIIDDPLAPLNRPIWYRVRTSSGQEYVAASELWISSPTPVLSDPYAGQAVDVTIKQWPELEYGRRATIIPIEGARTPIAVVDVETSATSEAILRTDTGPELLSLRQIVAAGGFLYLRASCPGVEDTWIIPTKRSERRLTLNPSDHRRHHAMTLAHFDAAPWPDQAPTADTLGDLADAVNQGTLADIASRWPNTLGEIAAADLRAL